MDNIKLEIFKIIEKNGTLLIHKELPEEYFPVLNKMEAYGLIKKEKGSYKMSIKGYEELDLLKAKTNNESVEVVKYDLDFKLLKEMIGSNELEEAINHMLSQSIANSKVSNQLIVILSRFKKLKDSMIEGTISSEEQKLEKNRITISVLEIIRSLEEKK